ncbi:MAG: Hsp20/alpha crystallin family protein [Candidatus Niyogibacteria bacterium]|nr:Hsp20/alpha crystallin family protein [Candidatus Niyogibacteria bacterium]
MPKDRRHFFERLTGSFSDSNEEVDVESEEAGNGIIADSAVAKSGLSRKLSLPSSLDPEGQLLVDVHQTPDEITVQAVVAGVKPEDLDVSITREMVTIHGKRERHREIARDNYFYQELYWGGFSRSIMLPQEVDVDAAEATIRSGMLTLRLPKLDKDRTQKLRVRQE